MNRKERIEYLRREIQNLNMGRTYARSVLPADDAICVALMEQIERRAAQVRYLLDGKGETDG